MECIEQLIIACVEDGIFPGAVVCLQRESEPPFLSAYGYRMLVPKRLPMHIGTLFDLASLTKPIATATAIMRMKELGCIDPDDDVTTYLPEFARPGIKIFHLLTHTSGLPAWKPIYLEVDDRSEVVEYLGKLPLEHEPGSKVLYSCLGYILLGEVIRVVTGAPMDKFAHEAIFKPLGMNDTFFNPPEDRREECAATEDSNSFERRMTNYRRYNWREGVVVGEVHDENAHFLGGVAGNAGLFGKPGNAAWPGYGEDLLAVLARPCPDKVSRLVPGGDNPVVRHHFPIRGHHRGVPEFPILIGGQPYGLACLVPFQRHGGDAAPGGEYQGLP